MHQQLIEKADEFGVDSPSSIQQRDHPKRNVKKPTNHYLCRRRRPKAPPGNTQLTRSRCFNLQTFCMKANTKKLELGCSQMNNITIGLPDVEAVILLEVQKSNKSFKDMYQQLIKQIRWEYQKTQNGSGR